MISPSVFKQFPQVVAAQSTRHGGVSPVPFHSLNLGKNTGDAPSNVAENRRLFCTGLGFSANQMAWAKQVHGHQIHLVHEPGGVEGFDALVTNKPGIMLSVSVADCTPILVFDAHKNVVAAIHAGWRGTVAGIVAQTLQFMAEHFGTRGNDCFAYVGACIEECSFEVGDEVAAEFSAAFKRFDTGRGKYFVDLKKANTAQLQAFGLPENQIEISPFCSVIHHHDFFSHRKSGGKTGRGLGVISLT